MKREKVSHLLFIVSWFDWRLNALNDDKRWSYERGSVIHAWTVMPYMWCIKTTLVALDIQNKFRVMFADCRWIFPGIHGQCFKLLTSCPLIFSILSLKPGCHYVSRVTVLRSCCKPWVTRTRNTSCKYRAWRESMTWRQHHDSSTCCVAWTRPL